MGSIAGRSCRPSRSQFSVVFSETRVNADEDPLKKTKSIPPTVPGLTNGQLDLNLQPTAIIPILKNFSYMVRV